MLQLKATDNMAVPLFVSRCASVMFLFSKAHLNVLIELRPNPGLI